MLKNNNKLINLPDEHFEDVGLNLFDVDGTGLSTSNKPPKILAGQQQVGLEAMHQLKKQMI